MKVKQWESAYILAAELTRIHAGDANMLLQTAHYIRSVRPTTYADLQSWLEARIEQASMFPRSLQTLPQMVTTRALVELIAERHTENPVEIAEILAWIARLMSYYTEKPGEARAMINERNPLLFVPAPPRIVPKSRPPRKMVTSLKTAAPKSNKPDFVNNLTEDFFKRFQQSDEEE